eukprot:TRINITY_DN2243_c0_g1_i11.p1 TRINITY_DN2243_c0_g1~~TRINITY_DN2243_c0_g1_i11.p1  ORF type:complete len:541 (-),score=109.38 TRINITY_DN2243_c0_g1_i11:236-1858(-)
MSSVLASLHAALHSNGGYLPPPSSPLMDIVHGLESPTSIANAHPNPAPYQGPCRLSQSPRSSPMKDDGTARYLLRSSPVKDGNLAPLGELSAFGHRYRGFCQMIHSARDCLKAKRRSPAWVLKLMQEILHYPGTKTASDSIARNALPTVEELVMSSALLQSIAENCSTVMTVFRDLDTDNSGTLDRYELRDGLSSLGVAIQEEQMGQLFECLDLDGNSAVDYEEFLQMLSWSHARASQVSTFPQIVIKYLQDKLGLQTLVDQAAWDLLCNVECFRSESSLVGLFGDLLEEVFDIDDFNFFLRLYTITAQGQQQPQKHLRKYHPAQMAPGEIERQMIFTSEFPGKFPGAKATTHLRESAIAEHTDAATVLDVCKRLQLDKESCVAFVDQALEQAGGECSVVSPVIETGKFYAFAIREFRKAKRLQSTTAVQPVSPPANAKRSPAADSTIHQLKNEIHHRVEQISQRNELYGQCEDPRSDILAAEVASRMRMLAMLGLSQEERNDLTRNLCRSPDYVRDRSCRWSPLTSMDDMRGAASAGRL